MSQDDSPAAPDLSIADPLPPETRQYVDLCQDIRDRAATVGVWPMANRVARATGGYISPGDHGQAR